VPSNEIVLQLYPGEIEILISLRQFRLLAIHEGIAMKKLSAGDQFDPESF
jgi:hypothetical protein